MSMYSRREFVQGALAGAGMTGLGGLRPVLWAAPGGMLARPTAQQLLWHEQELGMFFHYDIPVFKPGWNFRQWDKRPGPEIYNPDKLDTDQWISAATALGAKYVVLVAKHCTGFLQWQTDLYPYGCKQAPWRGGKGDLVKDFVESARRAGLKVGLYASTSANGYLNVDNPGIVNRGRGGDEAAQKHYNRICEQMCTELYSRYGELFEIWYDGGVLAPEKGGPDLVPIMAKHQPNAIIFSGPDNAKNPIRWIGNERGVAPYPCWGSTDAGTADGGDRERRNARNYGSPDGRFWAPGECDVPLYPDKWMWGDPGCWRRWSRDQLTDMYYRSVGRNCNLLLNANPDNHGLVPEGDIAEYKWIASMIKERFGSPLATAEGKGPGNVLELSFAAPMPVNQVVLQEDIREGHHIRKYIVEGELAEGGVKTLCEGTCIGHKRIQMFAPEAVRKLRLRVTEEKGAPLIRSLAAMNIPGRIVQS